MNRRALGILAALGSCLVLPFGLARMPTAAAGDIASSHAPKAAAPDYAKHVAPIFRKYCLGCHNTQEAQGGLILESYSQTLKGGEHGASIIAGNPEKSRLIQVLEKRIEPAMPPEGNKGPSATEIAVLKAWIQAGAKAPAKGAMSVAELVVPKIDPVGKPRNPVTAVAFSPDGRRIAVARYGRVEILSASDRKLLAALSGHTGNVNDVGFSTDGTLLYAAAGQAGLFGELTLWNTADWSRRKTLRGHRDALLAAEISPDGKILATASYDQTINLWDAASGKIVRVLNGHNGPVFDLAFDPSGRLLASASGDRTVKLWDVATGQRVDTLRQPTKDQYAVAFTPDGQRVVAGGVDSRIRVWRLSPSAKEGTNELVESLFAHDGPILKLAVSRDGRYIATSSEDGTVKIWDADHFNQIEERKAQSDWATALAIAPDSKTLLLGRLDGSLSIDPLKSDSADRVAVARPLDYAAISTTGPVPAGSVEKSEIEPNDSPQQATELKIPEKVDGVLSLDKQGKPDVDYFRFNSKAGQSWILETVAARKNSPADTRIDVLHADGSPVLRCQLRAIRDSAVTFRPINSVQGGVRLENWEEMDLDQFLYMSGEVCRLFVAPRGPDSEYKLYPGGSGRRCYFDTSGISHALNEPVYIVEPFPPGARLADNGLPVFPLYFANDDDGSRKHGRDSCLTFTAPADGAYLARVSDVRGYGGPDFKYSLTVREPKPSFGVQLKPGKLSVGAGGGQQFTVALDRIDNFEGPVRIDVTGVPKGYHISAPIVVEQGLTEAEGTLNADADAKSIPPKAWKSVRFVASAAINGRDVVQDVPGLREVKLGPRPKVLVHLHSEQTGSSTPANSKNEIVVEPGQSVTAMLEIERNGYQGELRFEVDNLPHGVIVDNIGLSGIMVRAGETRRQIFLTAAKWVSPTDRLVHAVADREGKVTSLPIRLRVAGKSSGEGSSEEPSP